MSGGNEIVHQAMRLKIMAALNADRQECRDRVLRLKTLRRGDRRQSRCAPRDAEKAGYIVIEKRFEDRKPQTRVRR